jgi:hypothetical protein
MSTRQKSQMLVLIGNVRVNHDGVVMTCNKAYFFKRKLYKALEMFKWFKAILCFLNSKYAEYNGNVKKAYASGDAVMFTRCYFSY